MGEIGYLPGVFIAVYHVGDVADLLTRCYFHYFFFKRSQTEEPLDDLLLLVLPPRPDVGVVRFIVKDSVFKIHQPGPHGKTHFLQDVFLDVDLLFFLQGKSQAGDLVIEEVPSNRVVG